MADTTVSTDNEPGYPIDTSASGTETHLSAFQKVKNEFERLYRIVNANLKYYADKMASTIEKITSLEDEINTSIENMENEMSEFKDSLEEFKESVQSSVAFSGYNAITLVNYSARGMAETDGFLIVVCANNGSGDRLVVKVDDVRVGYVTGDGTYGGSYSTTTIPVKKGSSWSIDSTDVGETTAWWFKIGG